MGDISDYMTFEEAAAHLGIARSAVYLAAARGDLVKAEVLGKTVLTRQSVEAYQPKPDRRRQPLGLQSGATKKQG